MPRQEVKCFNCSEYMKLEDIKFKFKGNQDNIYKCKCSAWAIERIRYNKCVKTDFGIERECFYGSNGGIFLQ